MNDPKLYEKVNHLQRRDAKITIDKFRGIFKKFRNGKLLDIGTGSGDVLENLLMPVLGKNFDKIIGSDMSKEMIQYANEKYGPKTNNLEFKELDLGTDIFATGSEWKPESFDVLTSFYSLHWIEN